MVPVVMTSQMHLAWFTINAANIIPKNFLSILFMVKMAIPNMYARPNNGCTVTRNGHVYDNRDVVPYNPYLSAK